jgi:hypothetical protein
MEDDELLDALIEGVTECRELAERLHVPAELIAKLVELDELSDEEAEEEDDEDDEEDEDE